MKEQFIEKVVDIFWYLGADFIANGRMDAEFNHRSMEVRKDVVVLRGVWKNRNVSMEDKRGIYEEIFILTVKLGC